MEKLTRKEQERYARHLVLEEIGKTGQEQIKAAKVLVVGAGGLGSPVLLYLTAAGIGTIGCMDDDTVSESNLQRQVLYDTESIGEIKVDVAARKLQQLNPFCRITTYRERLKQGNAVDIIREYDVVVDATDNLATRYIINDACVECGKPFVYGSICEFNGQVSVFNYNGGPTYRDLFEYHDGIADFHQPLGVVGALPGVIGSLQTNEVLKIILNKGNILSGKLLMVDLLNNTFQTIQISEKIKVKNEK